MARFGFDVEEVEVTDRGDFEIIPEGTEVVLKATECEDKETAKGGTYLATTFEIVKGEHAKRKIWQNFNIVNSSDKAQKIGREQVAGWARACGKPNAKDSDMLLDRPFSAVLGIEKGTGGYKDKNIIKSFLLPEGDAPKPEPKKEDPPKEAPRDEPKPEPKKEAPASGGKKNPWDD